MCIAKLDKQEHSSCSKLFFFKPSTFSAVVQTCNSPSEYELFIGTIQITPVYVTS